ncbi:DnaT-like ssDNA-binding protein [Duganella sp. 1224]|uniref:DnaT-like ssDNA-binding protein n=1 Tax=Duganella sp. 1224 TaxID=2587052 RepID=UPI0035A6851E
MLVIETGLGPPDAVSYASVAAADARCTALGVADWAPRADAEKEVALRRATQFMLANYRQRWAGRRVYQAQALDWPPRVPGAGAVLAARRRHAARSLACAFRPPACEAPHQRMVIRVDRQLRKAEL